MPYPFAPMPSLGHFIELVTSDKYRAQIETINMNGPRGKVETRVLFKGRKGKQKFAVIPDLKDDDILTPHVLRSLCDQLKIPAKDFGLDLG